MPTSWDLTSQQIATLALLVTLISAVVASITALVVTAINYLAARHLASLNATRERRLKLLTPLVDYLDTRLLLYNQLNDSYFNDNDTFVRLCRKDAEQSKGIGHRFEEYKPLLFARSKGGLYGAYNKIGDADVRCRRAIQQYVELGTSSS